MNGTTAFSPPDLVLRPLVDSDIDRLTEWLHEDHVRPWYHDPDVWLAEIAGRHGEYSWIHHFIAVAGDIPVGFCQYYDCYDAGELESWYTVRRRGDTFSIDYLVGDTAYLGKGYGKAMVMLLTDAVRKHEHAKRIIVQPDMDNHPSRRALMANGYRYDEDGKCYCKLLEEPDAIKNTII